MPTNAERLGPEPLPSPLDGAGAVSPQQNHHVANGSRPALKIPAEFRRAPLNQRTLPVHQLQLHALANNLIPRRLEPPIEPRNSRTQPPPTSPLTSP